MIYLGFIISYVIGVCVGWIIRQKELEYRIGNKSDFALFVSKREGLKKQVNIAQIKEIQKIIFDILGVK